MVPLFQMKSEVKYVQWWEARHMEYTKLQALVYNILPSTTAIFSYVPENCQLTSIFLLVLKQ